MSTVIQVDIDKEVMELINALINRRKELGCSQRKLAKISGIAQPSIARLERGYNKPRLDTIRKLSKALGMQPRLVLCTD